jgi:peptidoglycan hydrolase CwlO-like protein
MEKWSLFISIITGISTFISLVAVFVKLGREKGEMDATIKEIRKDVDQNAKEITKLMEKINSMQIENTRLISTLSSDLGWIKSNLADIKNEIAKGKE